MSKLKSVFAAVLFGATVTACVERTVNSGWNVPPRCEPFLDDEYRYGQCLTAVNNDLKTSSPTRRHGVIYDADKYQESMFAHRVVVYQQQFGTNPPELDGGISSETMDTLAPVPSWATPPADPAPQSDAASADGHKAAR